MNFTDAINHLRGRKVVKTYDNDDVKIEIILIDLICLKKRDDHQYFISPATDELEIIRMETDDEVLKYYEFVNSENPTFSFPAGHRSKYQEAKFEIAKYWSNKRWNERNE